MRERRSRKREERGKKMEEQRGANELSTLISLQQIT